MASLFTCPPSPAFPIAISAPLATTFLESTASIPVAAVGKRGMWLLLCNQSF